MEVDVKGLYPLIALMASVFLFNASEFLPVALLGSIADDLCVTDFEAGLIVSFYAWAVALLSLPVMLLLRRMEYKRMLLLCILVFTACQALSGISDSYWMLMASRIGVALSHAVFWSIVTPIAVNVVSERHRKTAISCIAVGTCIAMVLGLPLGRAIGLMLSWRWSFLSISIASLLVLIILIMILPKVPNPGTFTVKRVPEIFRSRVLAGIFVVLVLIVTGIFTGYSYIDVFLTDFGGFSEGEVTFLLTVFGMAGVAGSFMFSKVSRQRMRMFTAAVFLINTVSMLLLNPSVALLMAACLVIFLWGFCYIAFSVSLQSVLLTESPEDATPITMSIYSGLFNVGIASGTLIGGGVMDSIGVGMIGYVGGAFSALSTAVLLLFLLPYIDKRMHQSPESGRS